MRGQLNTHNSEIMVVYETFSTHTFIDKHSSLNFQIMFTIVATPEQLEHLAGAKTIDSLKAADFMGDQTYIDEWIDHWLQHNNYMPEQLPLCVSESLFCFKRNKRNYKRLQCSAIQNNNVEWLEKHNVNKIKHNWTIVDFLTVSNEMFQYLWQLNPIKINLLDFVVQARRLEMFKTFANHHGLTTCLDETLSQNWLEGAQYCIDYGADLSKKDCVAMCLMSSRLFIIVTEAGGYATQSGFDQFQFQKKLGRIPDIIRVEEFFWINGFKEIQN